jgi:epoxide hydrolase-like predicted phosphatase
MDGKTSDGNTADGEIRAVIFDFGGVLMRTVNPTPRRELEEKYGLPPGGASDLVFGSPLWDDAQLGRLSSAQFWADLGQRLGLDNEGLAAFQRAFWAGDRLDQDFVALVRHLRDEGYRTALLSNAPAGLRQHLEELGIDDVFELVLVSGEEGLKKPDPAIFELVLEQLGVAAEEAVFVDDFQENVAAARRVGLVATWFRGLPLLRRRLRSLGIAVPDPLLKPVPDVRAVVFDWGGVMEALPSHATVVAWERRLALAPGTLPGVMWWNDAWRQLSVGAITNEEYAQHVAHGLNLPDADAAESFLNELYGKDRFNREVAAAVRALRGRYKIGLLTNNFPGVEKVILDKLGFDVHTEFDVCINSAEVGLRKPDPAIFYLTLDQLNVEPQQTLFVDDILRNVDSARELGIHTVQFVDPGTSLRELEMLLGHTIG